ncbi:MAG: DUF2069 domain-containing protein [Pseudomonadales bacterium]
MNNAEKSQFAWQLTLALYAALLVALVIDHAFIRTQFFSAGIADTNPTALLLVLPGLIKQQARSGIWLCFMILFHFLATIANAFTAQHSIFYTAIAVLVLVLFYCITTVCALENSPMKNSSPVYFSGLGMR